MYSLKGLPQFAWIIIGVSVVVLLIGIFAYFKFRSGKANINSFPNRSNIFGEDRLNEPSRNVSYQPAKDEQDVSEEYYFEPIPNLSKKNLTSSFKNPRELKGQENSSEDDNVSNSRTFSVGGLYRRKPQRHKKKKQSLSKNKYKKHRKPRK
jgi:hypothetical protein